MNVDLKKILSRNYRVKFHSNELIEEDLKLIKKLNNLFIRLERSEKECLAHEITNVLKTLNNLLYLQNIQVVLFEIVEVRYHKTLTYIVNALTQDP